MSDITAVNAAFDAIVEGIDPTTTEETTVSTPTISADQQRSAALGDLIEVSGRTAEQASALKGGIAGYEASFVASVAAFSAARQAGNTEDQCRKALQADQKQSGSKHFGATPAGGSAMDLLATLHRIEGDLPEGYVFRPASNSTADGVPLLDGETSLVALVRKVQAPAEAAALKAAGHGKSYGKDVVKTILAEATDKAGAVAALEARVRLLTKALKDAAAAEKGPKTALTFLKAASGPLGKVSEALDEGNVGDEDEARTLIATLEALLAAAKAHTALAV